MENAPAVREAHESINGETGEVVRPLVQFNNEFNIQPLLATAGQLKVSDEEKEILYKEVNENDVEIRSDGLIYLPWMEYASRLNKTFGTEWAMIPQGMPAFKENYILWGFWLIIRGHYCGYAIGEQQYHPNNYQMTWGDACEGAKSNALMRLCKGIGITLELWKPSFIRNWKKENAESYQHYNQRKQKNETLWRRKGSKDKSPEEQQSEPPKSPSGGKNLPKEARSQKKAPQPPPKQEKTFVEAMESLEKEFESVDQLDAFQEALRVHQAEWDDTLSAYTYQSISDREMQEKVYNSLKKYLKTVNKDKENSKS